MEKFTDFTKIKEELQDQLERSNEKLLMFDIISIYKGIYDNYDDYYNNVLEANIIVDEFKCNSEYHSTSFTYHPKHILLDEYIYDYIIFLRKLHNRGNVNEAK